MQNCLKTITASKEKLFILWKGLKKWLEENCGEPESELKVSDNSDSYFSDQSDTETINPVAPDELFR